MSTKVHKVFVSSRYSPEDEIYKKKFEELFNDKTQIIISKAVQEGDIDPNLPTETVRQKIRDEYLRDSTVTVVLIGKETWQRKHIDWEISSSIRDTRLNPRSGLLGIFLPTYPLTVDNKYNRYTIPPRLYYNKECGFAELYNWSTDPKAVQNRIHEAFERRNKVNPDNKYPLFAKNRSGSQWQQ